MVAVGENELGESLTSFHEGEAVAVVSQAGTSACEIVRVDGGVGILHLRFLVGVQQLREITHTGTLAQPIEIARALATNPRFILLDEPFAGIDPIAVIEIQRIIGFLKARGMGVLITDHNVRETLGICDHACIISDGRVLAQGTPHEIIENADVRRVYLGEHFRM